MSVTEYLMAIVILALISSIVGYYIGGKLAERDRK